MVTTRRVEIGSGLGSGAGRQIGEKELDAWFREILYHEVVAIVWDQIPELFPSIKTVMMEFFDDKYTSIIETVAAATSAVAGVSPCLVFQYRDLRIPRISMDFRTRS